MEDALLEQQKSSGGDQLQGMESVVATVSGYHGSERFKLIKMISRAGASYVGAMTRSTTHLICWKFEGRKYELAKKLNIVIVNHMWVEDCLKEGQRIPEHLYALKSGQDVRPLSLEMSFLERKLNQLTKKSKKGSEAQSDSCHYFLEPVIDDHGTWSDTLLLKENLFPELETGTSRPLRPKKKVVKKTLKQGYCSSSTYCFQDPPLSELVEKNKESSFRQSMRSARQKRSTCNLEKGTTSAEPSCNGQKLVKKNVSREILVSDNSDSEPQCCKPVVPNSCDSVNGGDKKKIEVVRETTTNDDIHDHVANGNEGEGKDLASNLSSGKMDEVQIEYVINKQPFSTEMSCVICWTEFSSSRGVLPCGHRFCYPCIQEWADIMASRRKTSRCPLCKASFLSITKVDDVTSSDQKIYSQTIPCTPSVTDIFILPDKEATGFRDTSLMDPVCCECHFREPEDLLVRCHLCEIRCVHSYCLDPPLLPWTCVHCKDLRVLYHHIR